MILIGGMVLGLGLLGTIAAPTFTGYLIGSHNDFAHAFTAAAVAIVVGIAGYAFLLGKIERILDPDEESETDGRELE